MSKILRLISSNNEEDREIAKVLIRRDRILTKHLLNIAKYEGCRSPNNTCPEIMKYNNEIFFILHDMGILIQETFPNVWRWNIPTKEGRYYKAAMKSLKILEK